VADSGQVGGGGGGFLSCYTVGNFFRPVIECRMPIYLGIVLFANMGQYHI